MPNTDETQLPVFDPTRLDDRTKALSLSDGRTISYLECGDPDGVPLIYCHGSPGCRYEGWFLDQPAKDYGFRVVAPDRPGMGRSDYSPGYSLLSYTTDIAELADRLEIDRFIIIGLSGGGTTALSCAKALPDRVISLGLIGSWVPVGTEPELAKQVAPMDRAFMRLAPLGPLPYIPGIGIIGLAARYTSPKTFTLRILSTGLSDADRAALEDPDLRQLMAENTIEAFRGGFRGSARDAYLRYRDWGFDIADIDRPAMVHQGTDDSFVPYSFGEYLADRLPNSSFHTYPNRGHLGFFADMEPVVGSFDIVRGAK